MLFLKYLCIAILLVLAIVSSPGARAGIGDCKQSGTPAMPASPNMTNLQVPRDLPVGAAIPGSRVALSWTWLCASTGITGGYHWTLTTNAVWAATAASGFNNVYQVSTGITGVPGVGFRFLDASDTTISFDSFDGYPNAINMGDAPSGQTNFQWNGYIELVKISSAISEGSASLPLYASVRNQVWGNQTEANSKFSYGFTISKTALATCAVTNKTQTVILPTVSQSALRGSYAAAGSTPFKISLQCQKGSHLYLIMTDANYPTDTYNLLFPKGGALGLVSVKVEKPDGTRVAFGPDSSAAGTTNQWFVGDSPDGVLDIPLVASYQLHSSSSTAVFPVGPVQVAATFTLSYQ